MGRTTNPSLRTDGEACRHSPRPQRTHSSTLANWGRAVLQLGPRGAAATGTQLVLQLGPSGSCIGTATGAATGAERRCNWHLRLSRGGCTGRPCKRDAGRGPGPRRCGRTAARSRLPPAERRTTTLRSPPPPLLASESFQGIRGAPWPADIARPSRKQQQRRHHHRGRLLGGALINGSPAWPWARRAPLGALPHPAIRVLAPRLDTPSKDRHERRREQGKKKGARK